MSIDFDDLLDRLEALYDKMLSHDPRSFPVDPSQLTKFQPIKIDLVLPEDCYKIKHSTPIQYPTYKEPEVPKIVSEVSNPEVPKIASIASNPEAPKIASIASNPDLKSSSLDLSTLFPPSSTEFVLSVSLDSLDDVARKGVQARGKTIRGKCSLVRISL
ncbi:hypothetical protein Ciccas_010465 [Cichlidogyrus casuarinus]|uniref:Uncharacterized protein n=1 Tax=Cichlidogyrus casuarinus TaxID=1844966 RepID=A0ABD2PUL7_9PLAT